MKGDGDPVIATLDFRVVQETSHPMSSCIRPKSLCAEEKETAELDIVDMWKGSSAHGSFPLPHRPLAIILAPEAECE